MPVPNPYWDTSNQALNDLFGPAYAAKYGIPFAGTQAPQFSGVTPRAGSAPASTIPAQTNLVGQGYGLPSAPSASVSVPSAMTGTTPGAGQLTPTTAPTYFTPQTTEGQPQLTTQGLPNQGLTPSGGINYGNIPGMLSNLFGVSYPSAFQSAAGSQDLSNWLRTVLSSYPANYGQNINDVLRQLLGPASSNFLSQFAPVQQGNLQYLAQSGLPGNQQLQSEQQNYGNIANQLLGGQGGQYGLSNLLSQIISQGLPNQRGIEQLTGGQVQYGQQQQQGLSNLLGQLGAGQFTQSPAQQELQNTILRLTQGGGLTPEYVQSQRELVLEPSQEALTGRLNRMGGGVASLESPAYQELLRRNERDFNNQLIGQAFNNLQGFIEQGLQATGQGFGQGTQIADILQRAGQGGITQALQGFGAVPQAVSPFANLLGSTASDLMGQSLNRFNVGGNLGLQNLQTIQNLAYQPYTTALQGVGGVQQQLLGSLSDLLAGQQQYGINQQAQTTDLVRNLIAMFGAENPPENPNLGSIIGGLLAGAPGILNALGIGRKKD